MGFIKLEPRCPKRSAVVSSIDPEPNWTLDDLLSELNSLESKIGYATPSPLKQPPESWDFSKEEGVIGSDNKPFIMSISDDELSDGESDEEDGGVRGDLMVSGTRFSLSDVDLSESEASDDELHVQKIQCSLMHKESFEEGILFELERENQLKMKEQVMSTLSALEVHHDREWERSSLSLFQLEKQIEERREIDKSVDKQYQHKITEVLDSHLSAVQRDHEHRSQIEERKIRDEAFLEAKRKEKALHEENLQREKSKAEAEARVKAAKLAEEQRLALEAARRAAEEAVRKESERVAAEVALREAAQKVDNSAQSVNEGQAKDSSSKESGIRVMAAPAALKAEANRLRMSEDVAREISNIPHKDVQRYERKMFKIVRQISGTLDVVRSKAWDLINILNDPGFPRSISIFIFAQTVVSFCENSRGAADRTIFACARVIILVSSQVPGVMDLVLAELHKACIYTVPKHLHPLNQGVLGNNYWKMVGYREEDNKMESRDSYLERLQAYMKLYAALVQTEIEGINNPHGLEQGWAWLAMFLNLLPANRSTVVALDAFLRMAGFMLFRRYKSQFLKILDVISRSFLPILKGRDYDKLQDAVNRLEAYLNDRKYRVEPEGWRLDASNLLSEEVV